MIYVVCVLLPPLVYLKSVIMFHYYFIWFLDLIENSFCQARTKKFFWFLRHSVRQYMKKVVSVFLLQLPLFLSFRSTTDLLLSEENGKGISSNSMGNITSFFLAFLTSQKVSKIGLKGSLS